MRWESFTGRVKSASLAHEVERDLLKWARVVARAVERFLAVEAASGVLLLAATAAALVWANSPWAEGYARLWHTPLGVRGQDFAFERSLEWIVNDGLMVVFFFVVGLEIRREIHAGELSEGRRAALPAVAALGGMLVPAAVYGLVVGGGAGAAGWGVPMATDIAFAVGALTLLGPRVPTALRVLLLSLAVIDDLGAIVVIAAFYSAGLRPLGFVAALVGVGVVLLLRQLGVRSKLAYVPPSVVVWAGVLAAGVHPTIAGVLIGLLTPVRTAPGEAESPAESLLRSLHPWVAFGIMPLFALANAGVSLRGVKLDAEASRVFSGVVLGLLLGKPLGVMAACWLGVRAGLSLPSGVSWRHVGVLGAVAAIGFTMSLFIAQLAFHDQQLLKVAKLGVLLASGSALVGSVFLGQTLLAPRREPGAAQQG